MKKTIDLRDRKVAISKSGSRVLARVLAQDLREVRGGEPLQFSMTATRTDPPPGYDVTFAGSDAY